MTDWAVNAIIHVHFDESLNSHKRRLAVIASKIIKRVVSLIIFTSYARNVCLQHLPWSGISTNRNDTSRISGQFWIMLSLDVLSASDASIYVLAFLLEVYISSIWCKGDLIFTTRLAGITLCNPIWRVRCYNRISIFTFTFSCTAFFTGLPLCTLTTPENEWQSNNWFLMLPTDRTEVTDSDSHAESWLMIGAEL